MSFVPIKGEYGAEGDPALARRAPEPAPIAPRVSIVGARLVRREIKVADMVVIVLNEV